ncbi:hypothetical protein EJ997_10310 [Flaviflexus ciconiae]|uniref:Uncharacterized protein n=1 Tax=Flaviflexus ciconiae TaxID=2496867 RepID=A0A3Q9G2T9_9ACTO|nr:hypothetical protein [Flaviflexus ciconiae]AZQ77676.1 hypothetical protein EJ997_10310 [Flaviflexus ciconiae]
MALDLLKRAIPDSSDPADATVAFEQFSLTVRPTDCATVTEANTIAGQLSTAGATQAFPFFVFVQDLQRHMCLTAPGEEWIILGGRLHGATANIRRFCPNGTLTELHVSGSGFTKQSVGFTRHADGGIMIPETGLYFIRFSASVVGINSATAGRRFLSLNVNGNSTGGNIEFEGGTSTKLFDLLELNQGDSVMPMAYQQTGQQRDVVGIMTVAQHLTPSWTVVAGS